MGLTVKDFIEPKLLKIIKLFLSKPDEIFNLGKISDETGLSSATVFRLTNKLVKLGAIEVIKVRKVKLYRLNKDNARKLEVLL